MNLSSHPFVGILAVVASALVAIACGTTSSGGEISTTSNGTGAGGSVNSGGSAAGGSTGGATSGTGATTAAGAGGGASGGATSGTGATAGAGGGSGGGGGVPETPLYVVSIDHWATPSTIRKIDVTTGIGKVVCTLPASVDDVNYHSSTFSRDGILYASNANAGSIDKIDPCTCAVSPGGPTGFGGLPGITADKSNGLYGLETNPEDLLIDIDMMNGVGSLIGSLGVDFVNAGATWSDAANGGQGGIYAINSGDNSLYTIDPMNPAATLVTPITGVTFNSVGIEMHPANGVIYACTNDMVLYSIDHLTGVATPIGPGMGHTKTCNNLAAPWTKIACLDSF